MTRLSVELNPKLEFHLKRLKAKEGLASKAESVRHLIRKDIEREDSNERGKG